MSNFNFKNLDDETREYMIKEYDFSLNNQSLYKSKSFNNEGEKYYPELLKKAIETGDEDTLANSLTRNFFKDKESYSKDGKQYERSVPSNANIRFAYSEFNRFYIRGLCLRAIDSGIDKVEIYRARESSQNRESSDLKIGNKISAKDLLDDLRKNDEPEILPEVNSGLSVFVNFN